jgi:hypothetical protein
LTQVLLMLPLAGVLLTILGTLTVDILYMQRVAAQHANMAAIADNLVRQLRADTRAATSYARDGDRLDLEVLTRDGVQRVTYTVAGEYLQRRGPNGADTTWQYYRLEFAWRVEDGPRGDVLWLELRELPPPRKTAVLPRSFTTSFLLPEGG